MQEVPVGQMAQGTPFRCLPWPNPPLISRCWEGERGRLNLPSVQHARVGGYMYMYDTYEQKHLLREAEE